MSASSSPRLGVQGDLSQTSLAALFAQLETTQATGRVRLKTEVGEAEVAFVSGGIVEARALDLSGEPALFRLLGLVDGTYEVRHEPVEARPRIVQSVDTLVANRSRRALEWRRLSEQAPPLSAVLALSRAGEQASKAESRPAVERRVLALIDGRRTLLDVIEHSKADPVFTLEFVIEGLSERLFMDSTAMESDTPRIETTESGEVILHREATTPKLGGFSSVILSGLSLRKATVLGMGNSNPSPAGGTEIRRIISVEGTSSQSSAPPPRLEGPAKVDARPSSAPYDNDRSAPPAAASTLPLHHIGRYQVLSSIGRGGMGSVYLCRLSSEGGFRRLFALKFLRNDLPHSAVAAFLEEARLAGHIHHPNVVSVVDAGLHGERPYLVMDYVEGASLRELLSTRADTRPPELVLPIILDALAGLHAAHSLLREDGTPFGIVHCDVSPENLLVGLDGVCRLTDFGIARHATSVPERPRITHGKPGFLAPERVLGHGVDPRTDVFSMGVVLYCALTGVKLFEAATVADTLKRVCSLPIQPPSTVGLRPPPSLDFVCMKALEREPIRRFASAEEMMLELRRVALRENLLAPASQVATWVKEAVGRELAHRRLAAQDDSEHATKARASLLESPELPLQQADALPRQSDRARPPTSGRSHTLALPEVESTGRWRVPLLIASVLAGLAVLATVIWPRHIARVFRLNTEGAVARPLSADAGEASPSAPAPSASSIPPVIYAPSSERGSP